MPTTYSAAVSRNTGAKECGASTTNPTAVTPATARDAAPAAEAAAQPVQLARVPGCQVAHVCDVAPQAHAGEAQGRGHGGHCGGGTDARLRQQQQCRGRHKEGDGLRASAECGFMSYSGAGALVKRYAGRSSYTLRVGVPVCALMLGMMHGALVKI